MNSSKESLTIPGRPGQPDQKIPLTSLISIREERLMDPKDKEELMQQGGNMLVESQIDAWNKRFHALINLHKQLPTASKEERKKIQNRIKRLGFVPAIPENVTDIQYTPGNQRYFYEPTPISANPATGSEVYHGYDAKLGREVAIKIITLKPLGLPQLPQIEAKTGARVNSPGTVHTNDFLTTLEGKFVIISEWMPYGSLDRYISEGKGLKPEYALKILRDIARFIDRNAADRLLHLDLKPENIFPLFEIGPDGNRVVDDEGNYKIIGAKIGDFGIASYVQIVKNLDPKRMLGTLDYVSPERIKYDFCPQSLPIYPSPPIMKKYVRNGRLSEEFSLAQIAVEILTGSRIFSYVDPDDKVSVLTNINEGWVEDVLKLLTITDESKLAVLKKALSIYPSLRYPTASEFVDALAKSYNLT